MYAKPLIGSFVPKLYLFNRLNETDVEALIEEIEEAEEKEEYRLFCVACRNVVTHQHERIEVQGGHRHTFTNPHGVAYRIGCFGAAEGCRQMGPRTTQWTWFSGYAWQVAVCGQCGTHLGWRYSSASADVFHGLILGQLTSVGG